MAQITKSQMAKLFYRLEKAYSAGIDLLSVFRRESENGPPAFRSSMQQVAKAIQSGSSVAESFLSLGDYFPPLVISIVKAGERGGRLEESFGRLSKHYDGLVKFRNRLLGGMAWPLFELTLAIFIVGALMLILGYIFETNDLTPVDWFGLGLSTAGNFTLYVTLVFLFASTVFVVIFGSMKGWFGNLPMRIARRIPLIGKTIESLALSRLAWTMSIAENAGMSAQETAELALESTQNFYFTSLIDDVKADIDRRQEFYQAFRNTNAFPDDFLIYVENGEAAGELAETMDRASNNLQETAENNLKIISVIGFVTTFLFVAILIGATIIMLYQRLVLGVYQEFL